MKFKINRVKTVKPAIVMLAFYSSPFVSGHVTDITEYGLVIHLALQDL